MECEDKGNMGQPRTTWFG